MPDIRYHFIYLIAVFLMLGVGMLVGANFVGEDQIKRQTTYIQDLKAQANLAVQQGQASQEQLTKLDAALDALRPALVRGKLTNKRVTLIQTGDYADATQNAAGALRDAGAEPISTVVLSSRWNSLSDDQRATDLGALAQALAGKQPFQSLEDDGLVTITGDLTAPGTLFVLVGGQKDDGEGNGTALDGALATQMRAAFDSNAIIVGCEQFGAAVSSIPAYQAAQNRHRGLH